MCLELAARSAAFQPCVAYGDPRLQITLVSIRPAAPGPPCRAGTSGPTAPGARSAASQRGALTRQESGSDTKAMQLAHFPAGNPESQVEPGDV